MATGLFKDNDDTTPETKCTSLIYHAAKIALRVLTKRLEGKQSCIRIGKDNTAPEKVEEQEMLSDFSERLKEYAWKRIQKRVSSLMTMQSFELIGRD